jgi:hypothetical protein
MTALDSTTNPKLSKDHHAPSMSLRGKQKEMVMEKGLLEREPGYKGIEQMWDMWHNIEHEAKEQLQHNLPRDLGKAMDTEKERGMEMASAMAMEMEKAMEMEMEIAIATEIASQSWS